MNPEVWGPQLWTVLHSITFNYPMEPSIEVINHYRAFLHSLKNVIPCETCSFELIDYINSYPPRLGSKQDFINCRIRRPHTARRVRVHLRILYLYLIKGGGGIFKRTVKQTNKHTNIKHTHT